MSVWSDMIEYDGKFVVGVMMTLSREMGRFKTSSGRWEGDQKLQVNDAADKSFIWDILSQIMGR